MEFIIGQRWVSQAEPQLGLGIVVETSGRHVTVHYPVVEEDRMYAADSAPLARIAYQAGDNLENIERENFTVKAVEDVNGLLYYLVEDQTGGEQILPEPKLAADIQLNTPSQRLFSGQLDKNRLFQMRVATLHYRYMQQKTPVSGLLGPRTNLLPHQIYIAHTVASRFSPRVLLADEVGLGKTIEAGMILHHQLANGLASRALIVVPEPLLHQWLVEMLRKFNLHFSLFNEERYQSLVEGGEKNPFESEQLILCSIDLLANNNEVANNANFAGWDIAIVDEAHHLQWSDDESATPDPKYTAIEALAKHCEGLLLLTATPEQLGVASHFARLRLLDPSRYSDLQQFIDEQSNFVELNGIVSHLLDGSPLDANQKKQLNEWLGEDSADGDSTNTIVKQLLDRHGTGRVLFRNTRAAIKNFPKRLPNAYPLPKPELYVDQCGLYPETLQQQFGEQWLEQDPRVNWLEQLLNTLRREKVLLICAHAQTAIDLEKYLHLKTGIRSTAFYEHLSIIERDRAAAYFADEESGAQIMICSEIGSEGRNFQFAHHLVLFDLPVNPDLLEQRIGRLDRIGQSEDIKIHIPYIEQSAQEYLYRWFNQGLDAFTHSFSAGLAVYARFATQLAPWLQTTAIDDQQDFAALLDATATYRRQLNAELEQGQDHLLALNSCDPEVAAKLINTITESERSETLASYMSLLFDNFGIEQDYHSEQSLVLRPTEHMLTAQFPGIKDEGVTVTFNREKAQAREDIEFLSWEHPMVSDSMELVLGSELGNAAIGAIKIKALPAGTYLIECFFTVQCSGPKHYQLQRYLPATPIRVLLEASGKDLGDILKHVQLNKLRSHLKRSNRFAIIKQLKPQLEALIQQAQQFAEKKAQPLINEAQRNANTMLNGELQRLQELKKLNGSVREAEITFFEQQLAKVQEHIENTSVELQALRLIINT
jgi:ATP-dependent helicase HepA